MGPATANCEKKNAAKPVTLKRNPAPPTLVAVCRKVASPLVIFQTILGATINKTSEARHRTHAAQRWRERVRERIAASATHRKK